MRSLKTEELELVAGGAPNPESTKRADNGWGNGAEGTNNGSDEGGTAGSKLPESGAQQNHTER
jgi:hypothetical protein